MRSFSHIKWHGWIVFLSVLYLTLPRLITTLIAVRHFKGNISPLQPIYYKHLFMVVNGISIVIGVYTLIGIVLYSIPKKIGWCFLYSVSLYLIYYNSVLAFYFFGEGVAFMYTLVACFLSLIVLFLLLRFSRKKFHIRISHLVVYAILTLIFIFVEINKMDVAFALSRLLS